MSEEAAATHHLDHATTKFGQFLSTLSPYFTPELLCCREVLVHSKFHSPFFFFATHNTLWVLR